MKGWNEEKEEDDYNEKVLWKGCSSNNDDASTYAIIMKLMNIMILSVCMVYSFSNVVFFVKFHRALQMNKYNLMYGLNKLVVVIFEERQ